MFLQNAENLDFGDPYNRFEGFYLPKTPTFGTIFSLFVHVFSGVPPGPTFSRFDADFWPPTGAQYRPLGRPFPPKKRLLSYAADDLERLRSVLGPTLRPKGGQDAPRRPQGSIFIDFERELAPQSRPRCPQASIFTVV